LLREDKDERQRHAIGIIRPAAEPAGRVGGVISHDNARLNGSENSNPSKPERVARRIVKVRSAYEIVFVVARSRRGWNFNNYSVDFPGVPLSAFWDRKKGNGPRLRFIYPFPAIRAKPEVKSPLRINPAILAWNPVLDFTRELPSGVSEVWL